MAKLGAAERLKGKLERSSWVDNTDWVVDGEPGSPDQSIEFLEVDPAAYRLTPGPAGEPPSRLGSNSSRLAGLGALALVAVALFLVSRPDGEDPLSQLPYEQQQQILQRQNGQNGALQEEAALDDTDGQTPQNTTLPQPIPAPASVEPLGGDGTGDEQELLEDRRATSELSSDLPDNRSGVLAVYDDKGALVFFDWDGGELQELLIAQPDERLSGGAMIQGDVRFGAPVLLPGSNYGWFEDEGDGWAVRILAAERLLPADDGVAFVEPEFGSQEVLLATFEQVTRSPRSGALFTITAGQELLGGWQGRLLVVEDNAVGLLDVAGGVEPVTNGEPIVYDGRSLAVVQCSSPSECEIVAGPLNDPNRHRVPVPAALVDQALDTWATSAILSPDGTRLAVANQNRNSEMSWIDLETGSYTTRPLGYLVQEQMAWSPDGRLLAYASNSNLVIWDTDSNRSLLEFVDRPISSLVWFDPDPTD